jgi:hypothetical protein
MCIGPIYVGIGDSPVSDYRLYLACMKTDYMTGGLHAYISMHCVFAGTSALCLDVESWVPLERFNDSSKSAILQKQQ